LFGVVTIDLALESGSWRGLLLHVALSEPLAWAVEAKIRDLRASFEGESRKNVAMLRSIMDYLHSQILAIQKRMADY
jgi:hypothetical protein